MSTIFRKIFNRGQEEASSKGIPDEAVSNTPSVRAQRAAESILENEALTADLDDQAAQVLIDWGVALAQQIAAETAGLDEVAAEEAMYQPQRTLRKMLRQTNRWAAAPDAAGLEQILQSAAVIYGFQFMIPGAALPAQLVDQIQVGEQNPAENIYQLRNFIEKQMTQA